MLAIIAEQNEKLTIDEMENQSQFDAAHSIHLHVRGEIDHR